MTSDFTIAAAQIPSVRGAIDKNMRAHEAAIDAAAAQGASVVIFPELSLTGYEPELAEELALTPHDIRLAGLAQLAKKHRLEISVGAPLKNVGQRPQLGAIVFASDGGVRSYAKMHLGGNEPTFFSPGSKPLSITSRGQTIGLAICADASQPSHPQTYATGGATIYAAGVFLTAEWYATDAPRVAAYAPQHYLLVVMANQADSTGTYQSVGQSAIWDPTGKQLARADRTQNCLVIGTCHAGKWQGDVVLL